MNSRERIGFYLQFARIGGRAQLTLVEHSLCPLEPPTGRFTHRAEYFYYSRNRRRKTGRAEVRCMGGLRPDDEFYLWAITNLAISQNQASNEFHASARYTLRKLGFSEGGERVANLRERLTRLARCHYSNPAFYDPVRREHRHVEFGFMSLDIPRSNESGRPWRIAFDPVFFDYCTASGSYLSFDLDTYRRLRPASRRLYLLLKKLFYKKEHTHYMDVRHLAIHVLGFAEREQYRLNEKVFRCAKDLVELGLLELPDGGQRALCEKTGKGVYRVRFRRGLHFDEQPATRGSLPEEQQAQYELLKDIGLNATCIRRVLKECATERIIDWTDATMLARERWGDRYFKTNAAAFFWEGVYSGRNPPDWFLEEKRKREREAWAKAGKTLERFCIRPASQQESRPNRADAFLRWLKHDGRQQFIDLTRTLGDATQAEDFLRKQFHANRENSAQITRVGDLLRDVRQVD